MDFSVSDVGYVPRSFGHCIENTGGDTLRFVEILASSRYEDVSLAGWMAKTPAELVADYLNVDEVFLRALNEGRRPVVPT